MFRILKDQLDLMELKILFIDFVSTEESMQNESPVKKGLRNFMFNVRQLQKKFPASEMKKRTFVKSKISICENLNNFSDIKQLEAILLSETID